MIERRETQVKEDALFLRYYSWLYGTDKYNADFCKLFWAYIFVIPATILRVVFTPPVLLIGYLISKITEWKEAKRPTETIEDIRAKIKESDKREAEQEKRAKERKERWAKRYESFSSFITKIVFKIKAVWHFIKWPVYVLIAVLAVAVTAGLAWALIVLFPVVWLVVLGVIGIAVFVVTMMLTTVWFFEETKTGQSTAVIIKSSTVGFFGAMKTGAKAIKNSTCPKVNVVKKPNDTRR